MPAEIRDRLAALCRIEGATLYVGLLAAWEALLAQYSGQADFTVGTPVAGRPRQELEDLVGFFVNTRVLRADVSGDPSYRELLTRVRRSTVGAFDHQDLPSSSSTR